MANHELSNNFYGKDFVTVKGLSRSDIEYLFAQADRMKGIVAARETYDVLKNYSVPIIFFEASTRTFMSFVHAAQRLGADVAAMQDMTTFSSVTKGESFEDSIRAVQEVTLADAIVLRHKDPNSSINAAAVAEVPIINGGSGTSEHPTQALLDLYTIRERLGRIDNLNIALIGDLKYGRTIKSLAHLSTSVGKNNSLAFVSVEEFKIPEDFLDTLPKDTNYQEFDDLKDVLKWADVIYMTRTQLERLPAALREKYETSQSPIMLTREDVDQMKDDSIVMHPLPRTTEIRYRVDKSPKAAYFNQMRNGTFIRMALLEAILREGAVPVETAPSDDSNQNSST